MKAFRVVLASATVLLGAAAAALPAYATTAPRTIATLSESSGRSRVKLAQGTVKGVVTTFTVAGSPTSGGVTVDAKQTVGTQIGFEAVLTFAAPTGALKKGTNYKVATPQGAGGTAILDERVDTLAVCNGAQAGTFKVAALKYAGDGHVQQFDASFSFTCNGKKSWKGQVKYDEVK